MTSDSGQKWGWSSCQRDKKGVPRELPAVRHAPPTVRAQSPRAPAREAVDSTKKRVETLAQDQMLPDVGAMSLSPWPLPAGILTWSPPKLG